MIGENQEKEKGNREADENGHWRVGEQYELVDEQQGIVLTGRDEILMRRGCKKIQRGEDKGI